MHVCITYPCNVLSICCSHSAYRLILATPSGLSLCSLKHFHTSFVDVAKEYPCPMLPYSTIEKVATVPFFWYCRMRSIEFLEECPQQEIQDRVQCTQT